MDSTFAATIKDMMQKEHTGTSNINLDLEEVARKEQSRSTINWTSLNLKDMPQRKPWQVPRFKEMHNTLPQQERKNAERAFNNFENLHGDLDANFVPIENSGRKHQRHRMSHQRTMELGPQAIPTDSKNGNWINFDTTTKGATKNAAKDAATQVIEKTQRKEWIPPTLKEDSIKDLDKKFVNEYKKGQKKWYKERGKQPSEHFGKVASGVGVIVAGAMLINSMNRNKGRQTPAQLYGQDSQY